MKMFGPEEGEISQAAVQGCGSISKGFPFPKVFSNQAFLLLFRCRVSSDGLQVEPVVGGRPSGG